MEDFGECQACGYKATSASEVSMWHKWECARAQEKRLASHGITVEVCTLRDGKFYAPGTDPKAPQVEDPDAFKEGFLNMLEKNKQKKDESKNSNTQK